MRRNGKLEPCSWEEAWQFVAERLAPIRAAHEPNAVGVYIGNPTAHNIGLSMGLGVFTAGLGTTNVFTAGTVDQVPKHLASMLMFGEGMSIPVPDIEHTDCLLMLGANPIVSNGSLWMVPGFRQKLRAMQQRGGQLITVDPRRTETARLADQHLFIQPGTDAWLLCALVNELVALGCEPQASLPVVGWQALRAACAKIDLQQAAAHTGIESEAIKALALSLSQAAAPVVYGRVGTTLQRYGTLTSFLVEVINVLLGALDKQGGALFPEQPYSEPAGSAEPAYNRWQSRVSEYPEVMGQIPCAALAEEIEAEGPGQIRALVCFAGNPVVSNPDSKRLEQALEKLELMVCVDIYHNETTRLADVVLPGTSPFEDSHYDSFLGSMGWRNVARYSPPVFNAEQPREWDLGLSLAYVAQTGQVPNDGQLKDFEDTVVAGSVARYTQDPTNSLYGRDVQEIVGLIEPEAGVERLLDIGVRAGPFGDGFGRRDGLTLQQMIDAPDGIDLGELRGGRLSEVVTHSEPHLQLAPDVVLAELQSLVQQPVTQQMRLVGRRQASRNNSWLDNLPMLNKGKVRCIAQINPKDAEALLLSSGDLIVISSDTDQVQAQLDVTPEIAVGCISLPHGFSETPDLRQGQREAGANYNRLVAASEIDQPSGTSALNGVAVHVAKV